MRCVTIILVKVNDRGVDDINKGATRHLIISLDFRLYPKCQRIPDPTSDIPEREGVDLATTATSSLAHTRLQHSFVAGLNHTQLVLPRTFLQDGCNGTFARI